MLNNLSGGYRSFYDCHNTLKICLTFPDDDDDTLFVQISVTGVQMLKKSSNESFHRLNRGERKYVQGMHDGKLNRLVYFVKF